MTSKRKETTTTTGGGGGCGSGDTSLTEEPGIEAKKMTTKTKDEANYLIFYFPVRWYLCLFSLAQSHFHIKTMNYPLTLSCRAQTNQQII